MQRSTNNALGISRQNLALWLSGYMVDAFDAVSPQSDTMYCCPVELVEVSLLLVFYARATVFQLHHGDDMTRDEEKAKACTFNN